MTKDSDPKLRFQTLALRRELASDNHELSPVVAPQVLSYGPPDRAAVELSLALSELPDEARPTTVARTFARQVNTSSPAPKAVFTTVPLLSRPEIVPSMPNT